MESEKTNEISILIDQSITALKGISEETYKLIISKTEEGFFQQHQTPTRLKALAEDILAKYGFEEKQ